MTHNGLKRKLANHQTLARIAIAFERIRSMLLVPICIIALFFTAAWFGLFRLLPSWGNYIVATLFVIAFLYSARSLVKFRWPSKSQADRRIEEDNVIAHEGIAIHDQKISDNNNPVADILWQEHQKRMWQKLQNLQMGPLRSDAAERDPYALRVLVLLLFVTGFSYSLSSGSGKIQDIFSPPENLVASNDLMRIDAWVKPPSYINQAPIFLTQQNEPGREISIPEQSEVTIRVTSALGNIPIIAYENGSAEITEISPLENNEGDVASSVLTYQFMPQNDGKLLIAKGEADQNAKNWQFKIIEDLPPEIAFAGEPGQALNGALELSYKATDDYGIVTARAEIDPFYPPDDHALPLYELPEFDLQLPRRNSDDNLANTSYDLTDHPLAGEEVLVTLIAIDGAGQETRSETIEIILPQKQFQSPLARSMVEQRQVLAFDAYDLPYAIKLNDALTILPEETIPSLRDYLLIKSAREGLNLAYSDEDLLNWVDNLWDIALLLEDGELSLAERNLRDAQRALSEALENNASDEEIAELMDELRQAMQEYMQALAQNQNMRQTPQNQMSEAQELEAQDLNDMLDQIEEMARSGNREQAQRMLEELQNMMNNMQANRQPQLQNGEQGPIEQQMDQLGQILRQQQQLLDQTFELDQQMQNQRQQSQRGQQENNNGQQNPLSEQEMAEALEQLRQQQQQLQQQLEDLMSRMEEEGLAPTEGLGEAGEAMGQAEGELGEGNTGEAGNQQGRALQALRQGAQQLLDQLQEQMQAQGQGQQPGGQQQGGQQPFGQQGQNNGQRDPLGRRSGGGREGIYGRSDNGAFSDADNFQRAREILEIIRKRLGENFRLDFEKQYLERLLEQGE